MAIRTYLTSTLGATHLFMLDNAVRDPGSSGVSTTFSTNNGGNFVTDPVCEGVDHSFESLALPLGTFGDGGLIENASDINVSPIVYETSKRTIILWFKQADVSNISCVYEQGGGVNNFAIFSGVGQGITANAADSGQPFLLAPSRVQQQPNRPYFVTHIWEHHSQHAGSGNRVMLYLNGVLQNITELTGTDPFPGHTGDIVVGNSAEALQFYNAGAYNPGAFEKNVNMVAFFNDQSLTTECREIFERSVIPTRTIAADTVANQQAALDALIGSTFQDENCSIRIVQATDATDYRLFVDDLTFVQQPLLRDIGIQYVGPNTLTLENTNGSNLAEVSNPAEIDLDGSTILLGGGSIALVENTLRTSAPQVFSAPTAAKIVFEAGGTYTLEGGSVGEVENVSGSAVTVVVQGGAPTPAATETNGTIAVQSNVTLVLTGLIPDSEVRIYPSGGTTELGGIESSGTTFSTGVNSGANPAVDVVVHKEDYEYIRVKDVDLTAGSVTIPIQQRFDRNYNNP